MVPIYRVVTLDDVPIFINPKLELFFDTETDDLYGPVKMAQFFQAHWKEVLIVLDPDLKGLMSILDIAISIPMQNGSYDISTIQRQSKTRFIPKVFDDTFLLGRLHYYKEESHSLDNLLFYHLGYCPYEAQDLDKKAMQKFKWKKATGDDVKQLMQYAATDVWYMPGLYDEIKHYKDDVNYKLDMVSLRHALDWQNNGMPVDELRRVIMEKELQYKVEAMNMPINVNSYVAVPDYLGTIDSKDLTLAIAILDGVENAAEVRLAKKLMRRASFLRKSKADDNCIYGIFSPSARSGRFTCKKDNLQQLPHETKSVFGFPEDSGQMITYSDFSQIELRTVCAVVGERVMEKLYRDGKDLHEYARDNLTGLSKRPDGRHIAKTCNFLLLYGGGAGILAEELISGTRNDEAVVKSGIRFDPDPEVNISEVAKLKNNWLKLYPDLKAWQKAGIAAWKKGKSEKTALGRRYVGKRMTDHLNIKIQGSSTAEVSKLAMHRICTELPNISKECKMRNFQHDSYIISHTDDPKEYKQVAELVGESMQSAWFEMSKFFKIKDLPMPVDVHVGTHWGGIEENAVHSLHLD